MTEPYKAVYGSLLLGEISPYLYSKSIDSSGRMVYGLIDYRAGFDIRIQISVTSDKHLFIEWSQTRDNRCVYTLGGSIEWV